MSSKINKISKKSKALHDEKQLELLLIYFNEYSLMNHYTQWLNSRLAKEKAPRGLNWKMFFNPFMKLFRKK